MIVSNSVQASGSGVQSCTDSVGNFFSPGLMELSSLINTLQGVQCQQSGDKKAHTYQNSLCYKCNQPEYIQRNYLTNKRGSGKDCA